MFSSAKTKKIFFGILILAAILRFWALGAADMIDDEIYYTFRSIGYLDYVGAAEQTTPVDWFYPLPGWTHLSFHDHPPLIFLVQHLFFQLFGVSIFVSRLPLALAGLVSLWLVYLITKKLFTETTALLAMGWLAVLSATVWLSRMALMESLVVMFMLLAWYLFLLALEKPNYWYWWGLAVGLSLLTKYTALPILAGFFLYLLIFQRRVFKDYRLYLAGILILIVVSPVIIYNILLFQNTGHFDLQLAALFQQNTPEWQTLRVKLEGSFGSRLLAIGPGLLDVFSPLTLTLLIFSLGLALFKLIYQRAVGYFLPLVFFLSYLAFLVVLKPFPRFVAMLAPFGVVIIAAGITNAWRLAPPLTRKVILLATGFFLIYELFFSLNTNLTNFSWGWPNLTFSLVRPFSADFGVNALDHYLGQELGGTGSAVIPQSGVKSLDWYIEARARNLPINKSSVYNLLVYDPRLYEVSTLWLFDRRFIYQSIPTATADNFVDTMNTQGADYFANYNIYYITGTDYALKRRLYSNKTQAISLEQSLAAQGLEPEIISNRSGLPIFKVYKFSL